MRERASYRRRLAIWTGAVLAALVLFLAGTAGLFLVFDEVAYWRTLLRDGDYAALDAIFSDLDRHPVSVFTPARWVFTRELHRRFNAFGPLHEGLAMTAVELRAPPDGDCAAAALRRVPVTARDGGAGFAPSPEKGLCAVEYKVTNRAAEAFVMLAVGVAASDEPGGYQVRFGKYARLPKGESQALVVRCCGKAAGPRIHRVIAIAGQRQSFSATVWISRAVSDAAFDGLAHRAERMGLVLVAARHPIAP